MLNIHHSILILKLVNKEMPTFFWGFGYFLLLVKRTHQKSNCREFIENEVLNFDCDGEGLDDVPQDLNPLVKVLVMSHNRLDNLTQNSFKRYTGLNTLIMHVNLSYLPDYYIFRPLRVLETLDLEYLKIGDVGNRSGTIFYWPPSVKILKLRYSDLRDIDLLKLEHLEYLDINHNEIYSFPLLNALAPVKFLNLNVTLMRKMTAEDLAPLCQLEYLGVDIRNDSATISILNSEKYCECERLKTWIKTYSIPAVPSLTCEARRENQQCDLSFSKDVLSLRSECFARLTGSLRLLGIVIVILTIVIVIIGAVAGYYYFRKSKTGIENTDAENLEDK